MNRKLLLALQKRNNERLAQLRGKVEDPELRAADLPEIEKEIEEISKQLQDIADKLANEDPEDDEDNSEDGTTGDGGSSNSNEDPKDPKDPEPRSKEPIFDPENRSAAQAAIADALATRNAKSTKVKEKEVRSAFANFVVGNISEQEARSLGIESGNGSVTVPEVVVSDIITYAQEENLLRKYGSVHRTAGDVKYPVLVKKGEANVRNKERSDGDPIKETAIEFDEILLSPAEFDALATVTKKLLKMSGAPIEKIVIDELSKAYVRKETNYMFNGNDANNENPGALANKAVAYYESAPIDITAVGYSQSVHQELVKMKGHPVTEVLKKSMWIVNRAALTLLEGMTDTTGRPLLTPNIAEGVGYKLLGHNLDFTDAADGTDSTKPVIYFGDFKTFHIQDVIGGMEIQKLIEKFSGTNKVGFQIYNLLDGQLVYSPFEPSVYRYEVGATASVGG